MAYSTASALVDGAGRVQATSEASASVAAGPGHPASASASARTTIVVAPGAAVTLSASAAATVAVAPGLEAHAYTSAEASLTIPAEAGFERNAHAWAFGEHAGLRPPVADHAPANLGVPQPPPPAPMQVQAPPPGAAAGPIDLDIEMVDAPDLDVNPHSPADNLTEEEELCASFEHCLDLSRE